MASWIVKRNSKSNISLHKETKKNKRKANSLWFNLIYCYWNISQLWAKCFFSQWQDRWSQNLERNVLTPEASSVIFLSSDKVSLRHNQEAEWLRKHESNRSDSLQQQYFNIKFLAYLVYYLIWDFTCSTWLVQSQRDNSRFYLLELTSSVSKK